MRWKQLRIPLLSLLCANILFVFGRSILDPSIGQQIDTPLKVFPSVVPLQQWQPVESQALKEQIVELPSVHKLVLPGHHYRYIDKGLPLEIKMRYAPDTDGDVQQFIAYDTQIPSSTVRQKLVLRHQPGVGFYGLMVHQQRAHLNACINSRGGSTFTVEQFSYNRMHYDVQFERILPWLLAQERLRDRRCLMTNMSIPLNQSSPEAAYRTLEAAWFSWYQWWHTRFPSA